MKGLAWLSLLLLACADRAPEPRSPPPPPQLAAVHPRTFFPKAVLRGVADDALVVRITVDRACLGPVLHEVSAADFAAGVETELIVGLNVFSARSIGSDGQVSGCSSPVELTRTRLDPPRPPGSLLGTRLQEPLRTFRVTGVSSPETRVRLRKDGCFAPIVDELPAEAFSDGGFTVTFPEDGPYKVWFDAIDLIDQVSSCSSLDLYAKSSRPYAAFEWVSPQPTPLPRAWLEASGDFARLDVFSQLACGGNLLATANTNSYRALVEVPQPTPDWTGPFSARLTDWTGNTACVEGLRYASDPLRSTAPELWFDGGTLGVRFHPGRDLLWIYDSSDCTGPGGFGFDEPGSTVRLEFLELEFPDSGVLSARSFDGGVEDPCSAPLRWR